MSLIKNILMGFGVLFIVVILLGIILGGSSDNTNSGPKAGTQENTGQVAATEVPENVFKYLTYESSTTKYIDQFTTASPGYMYLILSMHINNTGKQKYSTNPFFWTVTIDGITYSTDAATFSQQYNSPAMDVGPGGKADFYLVYQVKDTATGYQINYNGF